MDDFLQVEAASEGEQDLVQRGKGPWHFRAARTAPLAGPALLLLGLMAGGAYHIVGPPARVGITAVPQVRASVRRDGKSAIVRLVQDGRELRYQMRASSIYAPGAKAVAHTASGEELLTEDGARTFQSRARGKRASAVIYEDGSVMGLFEDGDHVLHIAPPQDRAWTSEPQHLIRKYAPQQLLAQGNLTRRARSGIAQKLLGLAARPGEITDHPGEGLHIAKGQEMPRDEEGSWNGVKWFPGCYKGDDRMHTFHIGLIVDTRGWQLTNKVVNVRSYIETMVHQASFIYEQQMNFRLRVDNLKIYKSAQGAPKYARACPHERGTSELSEQASNALMDALPHLPKEASTVLFSGCGEDGAGGHASLGSICNSQDAYTLMDFNGAVKGDALEYVVALAHELGHNLGAEHSFEKGVASTGGIMDYGDGTLDGVYQFNTQYRKKEVCKYLDRRVQSGKCRDLFDVAGGGGGGGGGGDDDDDHGDDDQGDDDEKREDHRNQNGEDACETHDLSQSECHAVGCCHFHDGVCWSSVGRDVCVNQ